MRKLVSLNNLPKRSSSVVTTHASNYVFELYKLATYSARLYAIIQLEYIPFYKLPSPHKYLTTPFSSLHHRLQTEPSSPAYQPKHPNNSANTKTALMPQSKSIQST